MGEYFSKVETLPRTQLIDIQKRRLRRVVKTAYERNSFYHKRFRQAGISPEDIQTLADFRRKVPIYGKEDLRRELNERSDFSAGLYSHNKRRIVQIALTSGTTGPNTFVVTNRDFMNDVVVRMTLRELWMEKLRPGMKVLSLPASWHFTALTQNVAMARFKAVPIYPLGSSTGRFVANFIVMVREFKPDYMILTPTMLKMMLSWCTSDGLSPRVVFDSVKYASVGGEPLSDRLRRRLVDELGLVDIFESAGSVDGMWGGGECYAHAAHHPWMDIDFLEVVDPETHEPLGRGERGLVVNTCLSDSGSLYIRYDCGDLGEMPSDECECGRTHDQVEILDRMTNTVEVGGRRISARDVRESLESLPETSNGVFVILRDVRSRALVMKCLYEGKKSDSEYVRDRLALLIKRRLGVRAEIEWLQPSEMLHLNKMGNVINTTTGH